MLKGIVFDFDGVLAESVDVKTEAFRKLFDQESSEIVDQIVHYHLHNGGVSRFEKFRYIYHEILKRPLVDVEFNRLCNDFARLVRERVVASPWVPGTREFLQTIDGETKLFIVSGTPESELQDIVKQRGIDTFFIDILGSPREKPVLLRHLLTQYKMRPHEIVYVGDSQTDWDSAKRVGIHFIWRRSPCGAPPMESYSGPQIDSLIELPVALQSFALKGRYPETVL